MTRVHSWIKVLSTWCVGLLCALAFGQAGAAPAAAFTTIDPAIDNPTSDSSITLCFNGNGGVNCNIYGSKQYVWLNGGPINAQFGPGTYVFAVLIPGGQNPATNDCIDKNLSDTAPCDTSNTGAGDTWQNRVFSVDSSGKITYPATGYPGGHDFDSANNAIRLMPYDDTTNPGGEYVMAICSLANATNLGTPGSPPDESTNPPGVNPQDCKYDNFKVKAAGAAYVVACKFNDQNADGSKSNDEPFIPGWKIDAFGVVGDTGQGTSGITDDPSGCVTFTVSADNLSGKTPIDFAEVKEPPEWAQTAAYCPADQNPPGFTCSIDNNDVVTLNVSASQPLVAGKLYTVYFGNFNLLEEEGKVKVSKDATPSAIQWGIKKTGPASTLISSGGSTEVDYSVSVTHDTTVTVTGNITVGNTGGEVDDLIVTDFITDAGNNQLGNCTVNPPVANPTNGSTDTTTGNLTGFTLPAGPTTVYLTYSCSFSAPNIPTGDVMNNVQVLLKDGITALDSQTFGPFNFGTTSVTVTDTFNNSGTPVTLGTVSVNDDSPKVFPVSKSVTPPSGTCTTYPNTAALTETSQSSDASAKVCVGADLTVTKTASATMTTGISKTGPASEIDTTGSATLNYTVTVTERAWNVAGYIQVSNPNDWESISTTITDPIISGWISSGATCTLDALGTYTIAASGSKTINYSCNLTAAQVAALSTTATTTNKATASWTNGILSSDGTTVVTGAATPDSSKDGTATFGPFQTLTITDSFNGANPPKTLGTVKPGTGTVSAGVATTTFSDSYSVTPPAGTCTTYPNTAAITETNQSSGASAKVCVAKDLTVTKSATPSMNQTIKKTGPASPVENSGSTTLNYTVTVTESGWNVTGGITVSNPNDWESITATISDPIVAGWGSSCMLSSALGSYTIGSSGSKMITYNCNLTATQVKALVTGVTANTNTATATVTAGLTPTASKSGIATFGFQALTITDAFNGANPPKTLGTVNPGTGTVSAGVATTTFSDSYTVTPTAGTCTTYPNTATITQTGQSSSLNEKVCNTNIGALTKGFWQNNNGQGIITGANQGALQAYLLQFHPFSDAPASGIAGYVASIINGATCSTSGTCNTMLRAQMLATALDVYFSASTTTSCSITAAVLGCGGDKIAANNGGVTVAIGGVIIDLTKLCPGSDGGMSGTCPENASSAFGGATSMSVLQLLGYQNTADPSTTDKGANWYNQVKATQVLAKDVFDSINNNIAPIFAGP
jgi:hypothetical protein